MKIYRLTSLCGGYGKPKGHLDTQMFPECENKPGDRDVVKKNRKRKEKQKKKEKTANVKMAQSQNIDKNTKLVWNISTITQAKTMCVNKNKRLPKMGYEMIIDVGTVNLPFNSNEMAVPYRFQTYLQNNASTYSVWTWIAVNADVPNYLDLPSPTKDLPDYIENEANSNNVDRISKKKWNPNPWAVCNTTVDKEKDPEKFERCVQDVKKKQKPKTKSCSFCNIKGC